jgi:hypothetical protein
MTAASDHLSEDVLVFRPRRLRVLAVVMSVALCGLVAVGWLALPLSLRQTFTFSQRLTLLALLGVLELVTISIAASYVRADREGLRFRNGLRRHRVPWSRVHKIVLRPGDPWAIVLLLPDDGSAFQMDLDAEKRQLMGIQANDGDASRRAVDALRQRRRRALG